MRNSLEQSQTMLNQSQAPWAQTALNSLALEIIKTCSGDQKNSMSLSLDGPAIELAVWTALQGKQAVTNTEEGKETQRPVLLAKNLD